MLISATVFISITIIFQFYLPVRSDIDISHNEKNNLEGDDTSVDVAQRQYFQETVSQSSMKTDRDDRSVTLGLPLNPDTKSLDFARSLPKRLLSNSKRISNGHNFHQTNFNSPNPDHNNNAFGGFGLPPNLSRGSGLSYNTGPNTFRSNNDFHENGNGHYFGNGNTGGGSFGEESDRGFYSMRPIIRKSVYVHLAPPDDEIVPRQKVIVPKIPPKKNYQIVFIKAPTPPPLSVPVISAFPPQSDKTLIYVLHQKPEEAPPIHIPAPPHSISHKPEVYFIRYKTKKEEVHGGGGFNGGGDYHRRKYAGREDEETEESLNGSDRENQLASPESELPVGQYEDAQNDSSGESSNIVRVYSTGRGKNAH